MAKKVEAYENKLGVIFRTEKDAEISDCKLTISTIVKSISKRCDDDFNESDVIDLPLINLITLGEEAKKLLDLITPKIS